MVADRVFLFSLGRAAIIGSLCLAILGEYMSVGHSRLPVLSDPGVSSSTGGASCFQLEVMEKEAVYDSSDRL